MQSIKASDERGQKVNDWLTAQERGLANVSSGPSVGLDAEHDQADTLEARVKAQRQWRNDCQVRL